MGWRKIEMENNFRIVEIREAEGKASYTKEILEKLPEWFGNEQAVEG